MVSEGMLLFFDPSGGRVIMREDGGVEGRMEGRIGVEGRIGMFIVCTVILGGKMEG
jgi:hypothetical protein